MCQKKRDGPVWCVCKERQVSEDQKSAEPEVVHGSVPARWDTLEWLWSAPCESVQPVYRWPVASPEASVASEVKQCTFVSLLQWNLACDILMTLAIKRVQNLPPHLSYVSTLPDITQKLKTRHWRAEASTPGTVFLRALSTKPMTSGKHGCMHV